MPHGWRVCAETENIYYAFFQVFSYRPAGVLPTPAINDFGRTIFRRRFARKSLKHAVELRQRLKPRRESDFTYAQTGVSQQIIRDGETSAGDILDEIDTSHPLEIFAQIIRVHVHSFRNFGQGKLFV